MGTGKEVVMGLQLRLGVVTGFDELRGLGTVADDAGGAWSFHCTAISDGTRTVAVGTPVAFEVVPGHLGRMEATRITKLDGR
jgi:cold shock CspA family protein